MSRAEGVPADLQAFDQERTWTEMGAVASRSYPRCVRNCSPPEVPFQLTQTYDRGWLTSIPGFASSISYHPTGRVAEILHANGQRFTEQPDPHGMARPAGLRLDQPNGSRVDWQLGPFEFDGSGNLTRVGGWFGYGRYDRLSRWTAATMEFSPSGFVYDVAAAYDDFGNLTGLSRGTDWIETPTVLATNRLKYGSYDASGDLTAWHGQTFAFDPLGRLTERCTDGQVGAGACPGARWAYAYGPDEGRVLSYRFAPGSRDWIWTDQPVRRAGEQPYSIWTLRDEGGRVLHERRFAWNAVGAEMEDYVWRGEGVLAAFLRPQGTVRHFALDHLGSVRVVGDGSGALLEHRRYEPYGHDPFGPQLDERRQWAGHERDLGDLTSPEDDLDYMQARFYSATLGRFLSFDPAGGDSTNPQTWNRYAYVHGNPLKYIDPSGMLASQGTVVDDEITVVGNDPCPQSPQGMSCSTWEALERFYANRGGTSPLGSVAPGGAIGAVFTGFGTGLLQGLSWIAAPADRSFCLPVAGGEICGEMSFGMMPFSPARAPIGSLRSPMRVPGPQNSPATIGGRGYTGHALDQMQGRGIMPSVVEDTLARGTRTVGRDGATVFTTEQARVIVNPNGTIKTVYGK